MMAGLHAWAHAPTRPPPLTDDELAARALPMREMAGALEIERFMGTWYVTLRDLKTRTRLVLPLMRVFDYRVCAHVHFALIAVPGNRANTRCNPLTVPRS